MATSKKSVLIVEDNGVQALAMEQLVEQLGHKVVSIVDRGEEAIEKAGALCPDLIIVDVFLNGDMNGIEAMQEIRKSSDVPVIYISGNSDSFYKKSAERIGCADFLFKPVKSSHFSKVIKKTLKKEMARKRNKQSETTKWSWPFSLFF